MHLTPREHDRLTIFLAAELARRRRARGLLLTAPEAIALISDAVCEAARDGATLAEAISAGRAAVGAGEVLDGVADLVTQVNVEALFDDGSRLAVIEEPLGPGVVGGPGSVLAADRPIPYPQRTAVTLDVANTAAVPIAVTSHFHFFEANPRLSFDRAAAYGRRLAIPAGASVRFAPGSSRSVALVPIGGERVAVGFAGLVNGPLDAPQARETALERARARGYLGA
jgi:urease subunit gamma/beta